MIARVFSRSKTPASAGDVRDEVRLIVARQEPGGPTDVSAHEREIDSLVNDCTVFLPEWQQVPCVVRVARIRSDLGTEPFLDNVLLPELEQELDLQLKMLNFIREEKGLEPVEMPLFLHPDEIALALSAGQGPYDMPRAPRPWQREDRRRRALGGIGPRRSARRELRRAVLDRDGWECRRCQATLDLHLHEVGEGHPNDPETYVTLCRPCRFLAEARRREGDPCRREISEIRIASQLAVVFRNGEIPWVGFVFGQEYFLLKG